MKIFLILITILILFMSIAIVFAVDYYCPNGATSGCIDCTGTDVSPCNVCDVTNMSLKIYNPLGQLIGTEYLTYDSQSGTCGVTPAVTDVWTVVPTKFYFTQEGTYNVTFGVQITNGDWEYSGNLTIIVLPINTQDCTAIPGGSGSCHVCDVTDMYVKIYNPLGQLIGTEYLTYDSQSGTCGVTPAVTEIGKKHLGPTYFSQTGNYSVEVYAQIANGNWENSYNKTIEVQVAEIDFSLAIHPDWNLISIPSGGIRDIQDPCNAFSGSFNYWNATTEKWESYSWNQIHGGKAYWLRSQNSCTVGVDGYGNITTSDIPPLKAGYNFVGALSSVEDINSIKGTCTIRDAPLYWDTSTQNWTKTNTIEPTKGYWIYVANDCQFS